MALNAKPEEPAELQNSRSSEGELAVVVGQVGELVAAAERRGIWRADGRALYPPYKPAAGRIAAAPASRLSRQ